jgi:hypothetical protein
MKNTSNTSMGALHPAFFLIMYIIALVFSIFITSTIFHAINGSTGKVSISKDLPAMKNSASGSIASR